MEPIHSPMEFTFFLARHSCIRIDVVRAVRVQSRSKTDLALWTICWSLDQTGMLMDGKANPRSSGHRITLLIKERELTVDSV